MDLATIVSIVTKGISVIETVAENKDLVIKAATALKDMISTPNPTQADIDLTEAELDALLDEFNSALPADS